MNRANASVTVVYTYTSSTAAVATVSAAGMVTAVAPGTTTITVSAAGTGTGFAAATMTAAATITVSDRAPGLTSLQVSPATASLAIGGTQQITASVQGPRASAATMTYGNSEPAIATVSATGVITAVAAGTATITVTAQSTQDGAFAASSLTGLVTLTVTPAAQAAQVVITSLTQYGYTIDINNVYGQIEVNTSLQPNGQTITGVQAWVCRQGETVATCASRNKNVPAAQQTFTAAGAQSSNVQLYINTAEFDTPDFTTGLDADTRYKNGLSTIVATVSTSPASTASTIASNMISAINLNNLDSWTIQWTQPTNKANDGTGITWYGGPATPDALLPGSTSGTSSFVVVPVMYTRDRSVNEVTLNISGLGCGSNIRDRLRPFGGSFGALTRDTLTVAFRCVASTSDAAGAVPAVISSIDNNNASGPTATGGTATAATSIFNSFASTGTGSSPYAGRYSASLAYKPATIYIPMDYAAPLVSNFDVNGGGASSVDAGWVNASYAFDQRTSSGALRRYIVADAAVGLLATRNTVFDVCSTPSPISSTAPTTCSSPVGTGGLSSTVSSMGLAEAADLTNRAYFAIARETDRLGNRSTTNPFTYQTSPLASVVPATAGDQTFGVDVTAPLLVTIPNSSTTPGATITGFARTDRDSIYASGTPRFAVRFTDSRSGFPNCTPGGCVNRDNQRSGTFSITRRMRPSLDSYTNDALVEALINWESSAQASSARSIDAGLYANDNTIREWAIDYYGEAGRAVQTTAAPTGEGAYQPGYYTFSGSLVDRAGNSTVISTRSIAMDQQAPVLSAISPRQLTSGSPVMVDATGSDDLEVIAGDLSLTYPIGTVVFHRTPALTATAKLGFWHSPFASVTDNKLTTFIGSGTALGATPLQTPIGLLSQITQVDGGFAPLAPAAIVGTGKPTAIIGQLHDIRSTVTRSSTIGATQFADSGASNRLSVVISASQLANNTKNWGETTVAGYASPVGLQQWYMHNPENSSTTVEYRARTNTSVTNPPFTKVHVIRRNANTPAEWDYLGDANYVGVVDQGGARFFRWAFTGGSSEQGQYSIASIADQDNLIAIGADNAGAGLATQASLLGVAPLPAVFTTETVVVSPAFAPRPNFSQYTNATSAFSATLSPSANPQSANLAYTCASSNSTFMTAQMGQNGVCTFTPVGTVSAAAGVKVALTFTIAGSPQSTATHRAATITKTDTILRTPGAAPSVGISSVSIAGSIPATLLPGASFTLTATPTQPAGAPAATYNWTAAPAGFTATGTTTNSATYSWTGDQSYTGSLTLNVVASTAAAFGFTSASATAGSTQAALLGYTDTDAGFGGGLTPTNPTMSVGQTLQLVMAPTGSSNPALTTFQSCSSNNPTVASVSNGGLITAGTTVAASAATIQCVVARTQHSFGNQNYAVRDISTNQVVVNVVQQAITGVAITGTVPATLLPGASFTLTATPAQPAGAGAATYNWTAAPAGFTATGLTSATAIYTWTGASSRFGTLSLSVTAAAAATPGYLANSVTASAIGNSEGFTDQDAGFGGALTPASSDITPTGTQQLVMVPAGSSNPVNTTLQSCASSNAAVATVTSAGLVTGQSPMTADSVNVTCVVVRSQHSSGSVNYAIRSISTNTVKVRVITPAMSAVVVTGSIPATLLPGASFTLTANAIQPAGATAATFSWTVAPAGFTATGLTSASAIYTWTGDSSRTGGLTLGVTASAAASTGFSTFAAVDSATTALVNGYTNQDGFGGAMAPANIILNALGTQQLVLTPLGGGDPAANVLACSSNSAAATVSAGGLITAANVVSPDSAQISCTVSRPQQTLYSGVNYAAMGPTNTNIVRVTVVVPVSAMSAVSLTGSIPGVLQPGDAFVLTAVPTQPAGANPATYSWTAAPSGFTRALSGVTATYTWLGSEYRATASLTIGFTAVATASAGFSSNTLSANTTTASNTGYYNTDTPFSFTATPSQVTLDPLSSGGVVTGAMSYTNNIVSDPAFNSYSCAESTAIINITNAATGAYASTMGGDDFLGPQNATITCTMTRTFHIFGGIPYADRTGATAATTTATITVRPNSVQSVAFAVSTPVNMAVGGGTATVATSRTVATTPGALSYEVNVNAGAFGVSAALTGAGSVAVDASGVVTITTAGGTTAGTYTVLVKLAGAGAAGQSFANVKSTTVALTVVVP